MNERPSPKRVAQLVAGFIQQKLSDRELDELDEWLCASDENLLLFERLTDTRRLEAGLSEVAGYKAEEAYSGILSQLHSQQKNQQLKLIGRWKFTAAAALVLAIGISVYFMIHSSTSPAKELASKNGNIVPGKEKALLILADGRTLALNNASEGLPELHAANESIGADTGNNLLIVPAGGKYSLTLPDGTKVWLNSGSSLRYTLQNTVKERVVELTGEAYFEVTSIQADNSKEKLPFIVKTNGLEIRVLGTQFNVSAYTDDGNTRATLVEGSVVITEPIRKKTVALHPGEQAEFTHGKDLIVHNDVQLSEVIAWKNGLFEFNNVPIETIMKQLARWYNANIIYEGKIDYHFNATIYRNEPVNKVLELLEMTNRVHFRVMDKTIYVTP